jgi:hypothetical protein
MKQNLFRAVHANHLILSALCGALALPAAATERRFTYTYEPETMPQGALEFEQWVTLRTQRTRDGEVRQQNFNAWELREELEYGVTDRYTVGLYLNTQAESYRDTSVSPASDKREFEFEGVALENRYLLLNPAENPVGLTLYLEPAFSGSEAELEQKIILGQRHGDWKWAVNLIHETEWEDNFHETEGVLEATFGLCKDLNSHWSLGVEFRNHNEWPEYDRFAHSAFFLGPVVSYRAEKWWATLTVLPQVYGRNYLGNPDRNRSLVLDEHERVNIRLLLGFEF